MPDTSWMKWMDDLALVRAAAFRPPHSLHFVSRIIQFTWKVILNGTSCHGEIGAVTFMQPYPMRSLLAGSTVIIVFTKTCWRSAKSRMPGQKIRRSNDQRRYRLPASDGACPALPDQGIFAGRTGPSHFRQIERTEPRLNAMPLMTTDLAMATASRSADRGHA